MNHLSNAPKIIKDNHFEFDWDVRKVWKLQFPVEDMNITELEWLLDIPFWSSTDGEWTLTANQFMANPEKYERHYNRMRNSDIKYPIPIMLNKNNRWLLLDGLHRLCKLILNGATSVKVMKIPASEVEIIKK